MPVRGILGFELQFSFVGQQEKQKWAWWCNTCWESIFSSCCAECECVLMAAPWPGHHCLRCSVIHKTPTWERWSSPSCPSRASTHCRKGKGISSHWAHGFITLLNTRSTACEMYWKMPGNRNPEQSMILVLFPLELNVVGNVHTAKEPVMVQCCGNGALTRAQISWAQSHFSCEQVLHVRTLTFQDLVQLFLPAQQMSDAALPVLLLMHFRIIFRRQLRNGGAKCWTGMRGVEEVKSLAMVTWKVSGEAAMASGLYCPARSPYLHFPQVSVAWSSGSCCAALV